ncbi:MAG: hypothetical protein EOO10_20230 [Chitinophagaceae bacterium]|nr:MAG: hypothetical protein EOO10_20230 [Chitinophagaceae bacterium]
MDLNDELLKNTLLKNHQQYIGFIKTQENLLLAPSKALLDSIADSQRQVIALFNEEVLKQNVMVLNTQSAHGNAFAEIGRVLEAILNSQQTKEVMKTQFLVILENYIRSRDALKMMSGNKEKEELVSAAKRQVSLL